jgi:hypothetical protein
MNRHVLWIEHHSLWSIVHSLWWIASRLVALLLFWIFWVMAYSELGEVRCLLFAITVTVFYVKLSSIGRRLSSIEKVLKRSDP